MAVVAQLHIFDLNLVTSTTFLQLEQKQGVDSGRLEMGMYETQCWHTFFQCEVPNNMMAF